MSPRAATRFHTEIAARECRGLAGCDDWLCTEYWGMLLEYYCTSIDVGKVQYIYLLTSWKVRRAHLAWMIGRGEWVSGSLESLRAT